METDWKSETTKLTESMLQKRATLKTTEAIEAMREESDREFLRRREAERLLYAIKETLRPWWTDPRSNWDGSLCGLPTEVEKVAGKIRRLEGERAALLAVCRAVAGIELPGVPELELGQSRGMLENARTMARVAVAEMEGDR